MDDSGGSAKRVEGMAKRLNLGCFGCCSQGSAGRHRMAKTERDKTSMQGMKKQKHSDGGGGRAEKGINCFATLSVNIDVCAN